MLPKPTTEVEHKTKSEPGKRALLLLTATRSFYFSLGGFAFGASVSLLGAGMNNMGLKNIDAFLAILAITAVFIRVCGLIIGSTKLFYKSRLTVRIVQDRIERLNLTQLDT